MSDWGDEDLDIEDEHGTVDDDDSEETPPSLYYGSVDEFVREYLRNVYRRRISDPPRGTVALLGTPPPGRCNRDERVVARSRRPSHASTDGP
jgi:hypothetical protein